jgi:hypothetical protein
MILGYPTEKSISVVIVIIARKYLLKDIDAIKYVDRWKYGSYSIPKKSLLSEVILQLVVL